MRNPERIDEVLQVLSDAWHKVPDWRLGQLICNLQSAAGNDLFYIEDDQFVELINRYFSNKQVNS